MEERVKKAPVGKPVLKNASPAVGKPVQIEEKPRGKPQAAKAVDDEDEDEAEQKSKTAQLPSPENAISDLPTRDVTVELLNEAAEINERKTADEARLKEIKDHLINIAQAFEIPGVKTDRFGFMYLGMRSKRTLDKKLLIENGVSPEVIQESYKDSKPYADARFVPPK